MMKRILVGILTGCLLIVSIVLSNVCLAEDAKENLLKELNKNLPTMYDANVEITSIDLDNDTMIFNYRFVNISAKEADPKKIEELQADLLTMSCTQASSKDFLKNGMTLNYVFKDKDYQEIAHKTVALKDCEK